MNPATVEPTKDPTKDPNFSKLAYLLKDEKEDDITDKMKRLLGDTEEEKDVDKEKSSNEVDNTYDERQKYSEGAPMTTDMNATLGNANVNNGDIINNIDPLAKVPSADKKQVYDKESLAYFYVNGKKIVTILPSNFVNRL